MALFGIVGYVFSKLGGEPAPMLLAFILGPLMEEYLRRAMLLSRGNPLVFIQRPISATLLALAALAMCSVLVPAFSKTREEAFSRSGYTANLPSVPHVRPRDSIPGSESQRTALRSSVTARGDRISSRCRLIPLLCPPA